MTLRVMPGLMAVLAVLFLTSSSFAQVSVSLNPTPSAAEIQTNRTAQTTEVGAVGAGLLVSGSFVASSPLTSTVLTLIYPGVITSSPAVLTGPGSPGNVPSDDPIAITGATGVFAGVTGVFTVNNLAGRIDIVLPGAAVNNSSGSFRLAGVRLDLNGMTSHVAVTGSLSSSANNYLMGTSTATVISSLSPGIASIAIGGNPNQGTATVFTNKNVVDSLASFVITEGFPSAWRSAAQNSNSSSSGGLNSTQILLTAAGIPSGVTLTLAITPSTTLGAALSGTTLTSSTPAQSITFSSTSLTTLENIYVLVTVSAASSATITPGAITLTATMSPVGDALSTNLPTATGGYPRFSQSLIGPITVVNLVAANTTMLLPFVSIQPPFDTAIAIANTTADPFSSTGGGATPTSGTISVYCYTTPDLPIVSPISFTTSSTAKPGLGLSSDGTLAAGHTWTVLLSQVLSAAGASGSFSGYCFIQTNFLNAHGVATVTDFKTFSLAANVLLMPSPASANRNTPSNGVEVLGF